MLIEDALVATFARWNAEPFAWGQHDDCMMSVFRHCWLVTGRDAGNEWRGTYHDENSALRVLAAAGGGLAGMDKGLVGIGLERTLSPNRGDPVCARIGTHEIGGIYLGDMTAFRMEGRGRMDIAVKHIGAWHLC